MNNPARIANLIAPAVAALGGEIAVDDILEHLSVPPNPALGDLSFPCFLLARSMRQAPPKIAAALAEQIADAVATEPTIASASAVGPYLNFKLDPAARARSVLSAAVAPTYGHQTIGAGKTIGIDFSSPNIAKPFGIGHLRSTAIGAAIGRIFTTLGYQVVGVNHLGDWGTQFGKLIAAFERWGDRSALEAEPIAHLYALYVRFHQEAEAEPALLDEGRGWFKRLEDGDAEAVRYWDEFRTLSLREFERIYARLGVSFDHYWGEAYYNDMLDDVVEDIEAAGIAEVSEGALVVPMDDLDMPPCLIRKTDGATLYATRDLAAARYRYDQLKFDKFLYVVGAPQTVHFRQVFEVLRRMNYAWAEDCIHVPFGLIHGISTRKGTLVFLDDILETGKQLVRDQLAERDDTLDEATRDAIAEQIAIGAVVFQDLSRNRIKDYDFSWERMLLGLRPGERGPTGVYAQYTIARLRAVIANYEERIGALPDVATVDFGPVADEAAQPLVAHLEKWPETLRQAADQYEPAVVTRYVLDLAEAFNAFYSGGHRIVVPEEAAQSAARVTLCAAAANVMSAALGILGVPTPDRI